MDSPRNILLLQWDVHQMWGQWLWWLEQVPVRTSPTHTYTNRASRSVFAFLCGIGRAEYIPHLYFLAFPALINLLTLL
jgi:hypothetical protein